MGVQSVFEKYAIPVKRGMTVRDPVSLVEGRITYVDGTYIRATTDRHSQRVGRHPGDYDYLIDGVWKLGNDYIKRLNARWDIVNDAWNKRITTEQANEALAKVPAV